MGVSASTLTTNLVALKHKHAARGSAADVAYWTVRDAIRTGAIRSGERLIEVELAEALAMSRTPVREALRRLEVEKLIENLPRRGLVVPTITLDDLVEIFEIREVLEGLAARRAAQRIGPAEVEAMRVAVERTEAAWREEDLHALSEGSRAFHDLLRTGSRNTRLPELIRLLEDAHRSWWLHQFAPERTEAAVREHRAIFEAVERHDVEVAERLTREHVQNALKAQILAHGRSTEP